MCVCHFGKIDLLKVSPLKGVSWYLKRVFQHIFYL